MLKQSLILCSGALTFFVASCNTDPSGSAHKKTQGDILKENLDTSVNPANDFFEYANGGWIKSHPIPDDRKSFGISALVQEDLYERLKTINEQAMDHPEGAISKKIAAFWKSGMDSVAINKQGITALKPELDMIDNINTKEDVLKAVVVLDSKGVGAMFSSYIGQDDMNSEKMAFMLSQGGLGLPNRDYYFNNDDRTRKIREAYPKHIERMLNVGAFAPLASFALFHMVTVFPL
ncbi:MAG: hypothetical protein EOP49_35410, partial [Sphingobacteriales bacterium]